MLPDFSMLSPYRNDRNSLEVNHLILVWIMKVKGPKNQADFIEVREAQEAHLGVNLRLLTDFHEVFMEIYEF